MRPTRSRLGAFWGVSASALGTYEAVAFLSNQRLPLVSTYCARRRARKLMMVSWCIGLALHIWRNEIDQL